MATLTACGCSLSEELECRDTKSEKSDGGEHDVTMTKNVKKRASGSDGAWAKGRCRESKGIGLRW